MEEFCATGVRHLMDGFGIGNDQLTSVDFEVEGITGQFVARRSTSTNKRASRSPSFGTSSSDRRFTASATPKMSTSRSFPAQLRGAILIGSFPSLGFLTCPVRCRGKAMARLPLAPLLLERKGNVALAAGPVPPSLAGRRASSPCPLTLVPPSRLPPPRRLLRDRPGDVPLLRGPGRC